MPALCSDGRHGDPRVEADLLSYREKWYGHVRMVEGVSPEIVPRFT